MPKVTIKSPHMSEYKTLNQSFSFTCLLSPIIVSIVRKDWKWMRIIFLTNFAWSFVIRQLDSIPIFLSCLVVSNLVWAFIYNRIWLGERILQDGWTAVDDESQAFVDELKKQTSQG